MINQYLAIFLFILFSGILAFFLFGVSFILAEQKPETEKLSPYECGFNPFDDARHKFDVRFYLVAILFLIFDLEVSFLFPWAISFSFFTPFAYLTMFLFLVLLTIGFYYEWMKGGLEWE